MKAVLPGAPADTGRPVLIGEAPEPEPAGDEAVVAVERPTAFGCAVCGAGA
jgi:hypothetical protein